MGFEAGGREIEEEKGRHVKVKEAVCCTQLEKFRVKNKVKNLRNKVKKFQEGLDFKGGDHL